MSLSSGMVLPVLIGLPGAGKSSVTRHLADRFGLTVFASDAFFRECRALPRDSPDPRREIMERFLKRWSSEHPNRVEALRRDADAIDDMGRCALCDGRLFRTHGEDAFRTYENEMLRWAMERGLLSGAIPDLSAAAPTRTDNQVLFDPAHGFVPVLLDASREVLVRNVLADYAKFCDERSAGRDRPTRGEYERDLDAAISGTGPSRIDQYHVAEEAVREKLQTAAAARLPLYHSYAKGFVQIGLEDGVEDVAAAVLRVVGIQ